jgi:hypothetical protein
MNQRLHVFIIHLNMLIFSLFDILELHVDLFIILCLVMMFTKRFRQFKKTIFNFF